MSEKKFIIDVDRVIESFNEKNPKLKQLDRRQLAIELDVNPQVFSDWKSGKKTPKLIDKLFRLKEIGKCKIEDFVVNQNEK